VINNRRRTRCARSKRLQRLRSERGERSFAHVCDTGGARRRLRNHCQLERHAESKDSRPNMPRTSWIAACGWSRSTWPLTANWRHPVLDRRRPCVIMHPVHREDRALLGSNPSARCDARRWTGALTLMPRLLSSRPSHPSLGPKSDNPTVQQPINLHPPIDRPRSDICPDLRDGRRDSNWTTGPSSERLGYSQMPLRGKGIRIRDSRVYESQR
jgi:hypothetical protein